MKVLKFGGSSVGSADSINQVVDIIRKASEVGRCAVVLSAMQGTTDELIETGRDAERGDETYVARLSNIRERHLSTVAQLFAGGANDELTAFIETTLKELENLCEGVRLVRELSPKTLDRILSFGELVASKM